MENGVDGTPLTRRSSLTTGPIDFPVACLSKRYIDEIQRYGAVTYLNGWYDENGVARHGYAAERRSSTHHGTLDTTTTLRYRGQAIACLSKR